MLIKVYFLHIFYRSIKYKLCFYFHISFVMYHFTNILSFEFNVSELHFLQC